jgi:pyruvate formate lyase activating enzyme
VEAGSIHSGRIGIVVQCAWRYVLITGTVFDIRKFSIHDGPGIRTTVFLKGCPLRCAWCHNPESQSAEPELIMRSNRCLQCGACVEACPKDAIRLDTDGPITDQGRCERCGLCVDACFSGARKLAGRELTVAQVMAEIERDRPFYDESGGGATFSGGEPLRQPEFLSELLISCRTQEIHTALDTCGYAPWSVLDRIRPYVDLFLYDIKTMAEAQHRALTGVSNRMILENLRALSELGHAIVLRVPVIPGINDGTDNIRAIGSLAAHLPSVMWIELLPYHRIGVEKYGRIARPYSLPEIHPPSQERIAAISRILQEHAGLLVEVR